MKKYLLALCILVIAFKAVAQRDSLISKYSFIIQDSPSRLFTMRQFNQGYLSGYRLLARGLNSNIKNQRVSDLIQLGLLSVFLVPLSHEEGHRSILTGKKISSISRPFFNSKGAAYVIGVTDQTLMELRDSDLPNYIRLHTAGLESDYALTSRSEDISIFEQDQFANLKWEYLARKFGILQYYIMGLLDIEIDLEEEPNELDRDIVGFDTYGAARHLFRPEMSFYRYTRHDELTSEERKFVNRIGARSLLNLLNPLILGKVNFQINESLKMNWGFGHTMTPFGDFIDENIWMIINDKTNLKVYLRQFQNRNTWFHGGGIGLYGYQLSERCFIDSKVHAWNQPKDLDFNTSEGEFGGAFEFDMSYFFQPKQGGFKGISMDLGTTMKTQGFLPEELFLQERIGVRMGTTVWF
ncbi:MAG: hypothetical protein RIC35_11125 [Marinoscillum sp.]